MPLKNENNTWFMDEPVAIRFQKEDEKEIMSHKHRFVEFVYTLGGKCIHTIDGAEYPVCHGDLLLINYGQTHAVLKGKKKFFNILLKPEYIDSNLNQPENAFALLNLSEFEDFCKIIDEGKCIISFSGREREEFEMLIYALKREYDNPTVGSQLAMRSVLNMLLIEIFRKMIPSTGFETNGITNELLGYLRLNCHERITLEQISKKCHYSPAYFSRIFHASTDMTFTEYMKKVRIEKACYLLENTDEAVGNICTQVGYSDKTKFFRHFRELKDMTPLQWRVSKKEQNKM